MITFKKYDAKNRIIEHCHGTGWYCEYQEDADLIADLLNRIDDKHRYTAVGHDYTWEIEVVPAYDLL